MYVEVKIPNRRHHYTAEQQRPSDDGEPFLTMAELGEDQTRRRTTSTSGLEICNRQGAKSLTTPDQRQQTSAWCGAATARIVMEHHNGPLGKATDAQCVIISKVFDIDTNRHNCCQTHFPSEDTIIPSRDDIEPCVRGIWPHEAFRKYGFSYKQTPQALDWERLTEEICLDSPFIAVTKTPDQPNSHTIVVKGYSHINPSPSPSTIDELQWVEIYDPLDEEFEFVSYSEFVGDPPNTSGVHGYYHIRNYAGIVPLVAPTQ